MNKDLKKLAKILRSLDVYAKIRKGNGKRIPLRS